MSVLKVRFIMALLGMSAASGALDQADYQRGLDLRNRFSGKVFGEKIEPYWADDGGMLVYKARRGSDTHDFIAVDTATGHKQPAFDHDRLAEALNKTQKSDYSGTSLPLEKLKLDGKKSILRFEAAGFHWSCDLSSYQLDQLGPAEEEVLSGFAPDRGPRSSLETGDEIILTFVNSMEKEVEIFWLDLEGRRRSYAVLLPGQRHQQHTYVGHIWLAAEKDGPDIAVYKVPRKKACVRIGEKPLPDRDQRSRRDRRDSMQSPDGRWKALIREHNVWLSDPNDNVQLTTDGTAEDAYTAQMAWSPDSKKLAVLRTKPAQDHKIHFVESSPAGQVQPRLHSVDYLKPGDQVAVSRPYLFEVESRTSIPVSDALFSNPYSLNDLRWQADASRFTVVYNQRGHQVLRVVAIDAVTGKTSAVIDEKSDTFICYSSKFFCDYLDDTAEILWMSERDGWNHLYLYDAATGRVKNQVTKGPWVVRSVEHVDKEKRQVWFRASGIYPSQDPYYLHYARVNFDGTGLTILTEANGTHTVQYSPGRRFLIATWSRVNQPPVHELRRGDDGKRVCTLETADHSALLKAGWQTPEPFCAKGRDGTTDIYGVIVRPTNFDPNVRYPVIEYIYAGPHDSFVPKSFSPYIRMMEVTELGFILVVIDGMGTSNRSKTFHDVCWKNLADAGLPDRILWMQAAAQKYTYMDIGRVGVYGCSAGGQNAAAAVMTHGDFYKAAVADCGCHDNRMDKIWWNEQWMGWPVGPHYEANSNVTLAPGLSGKLLLIVGEIDSNVDPASTMQVVNALVKADKDFEMLVIPGVGHGASDSVYGARRRAEFFVRHLLDKN